MLRVAFKIFATLYIIDLFGKDFLPFNPIGDFLFTLVVSILTYVSFILASNTYDTLHLAKRGIENFEREFSNISSLDNAIVISKEKLSEEDKKLFFEQIQEDIKTLNDIKPKVVSLTKESIWKYLLMH